MPNLSKFQLGSQKINSYKFSDNVFKLAIVKLTRSEMVNAVKNERLRKYPAFFDETKINHNIDTLEPLRDHFNKQPTNREDTNAEKIFDDDEEPCKMIMILLFFNL